MISIDQQTTEEIRPFFSVIITTYNRGNLLKRALDSLLAQTESDWEAIIIDDGSTDDTEVQMKPYLQKSKKIKYKKKKREGYSLAKNAGVSFAFGKFITFLDSDDEYDPAHFGIEKKDFKK